MKFAERIAQALLGRAIEQRVQAAIKVMDDAYWRPLTAPPALLDRTDHRTTLEKLARLERTNPLAHRLIRMKTDFVIGGDISLTGDPWARAFWEHPQNHLATRAYRWCDELTRAGELFIVLSTNPVDRMSYVREIPALAIDQIETDPDDLERELRYHQLTASPLGRWWPSPLGATEGALDQGNAPQVMLHYTVNKPIGETRGQSDLMPVVPWLERYELWLEDRVRINRYKGAYLWNVQIEGALPGELEAKRAQYARPPQSGSIIVCDARERWTAVRPEIGADDAEADGKALRLMIAAGMGVPLHFLAEGESATRATAREMNGPTYRHFAHRQFIFEQILRDVIRQAARRAGLAQIEVDIRFESVLGAEGAG